MENKKILISGAGVSGLALAYWLRRYGFTPTLVERSPSLRVGGYKVDIRGVALDAIKRMGIYSHVSEAHTDMLGATIVDRFGKTITTMSGETFNLRTNEDLEIVRGDLCQILMDLATGVEILFDDSVQKISQNTNGVYVDFDKNASRTFDLVVGADGLHSNIRNQVFGKESKFAHELGMYISIFTVPNSLNLNRWEVECTEPGKLVNLYSTGIGANAKAAFLFNSKPLQINSRDIKQQQEQLRNVYADIDWEVPRLLDAMEGAPDFYFDSVSQICMDHWSSGRVTLVGDAGYCASPVSGQGTSLALIGAYVLAGELAATSGNYTNAFSQYEALMRRYVAKNQKLGRTFARNMTSENKNRVVIWLHELLMHTLPDQWVNFLTNRSVRRVNRAANAITLKNYERPKA